VELITARLLQPQLALLGLQFALSTRWFAHHYRAA
jgi:hypothetical protein